MPIYLYYIYRQRDTSSLMTEVYYESAFYYNDACMISLVLWVVWRLEPKEKRILSIDIH